MRSLRDPNTGELSNPFFGNGNLFWPGNPSTSISLFPGTEVAVDDYRIGDAVVRIAVGLFWVENDKYLPDDYEVEVIGSYDPSFMSGPVQQSVRWLERKTEPVNIGDGVFKYWWSRDEQAPRGEAHQSDCLLQFYEGTSFLCRIARPQENASPSNQWAHILPGYLRS